MEKEAMKEGNGYGILRHMSSPHHCLQVPGSHQLDKVTAESAAGARLLEEAALDARPHSTVCDVIRHQKPIYIYI